MAEICNTGDLIVPHMRFRRSFERISCVHFSGSGGRQEDKRMKLIIAIVQDEDAGHLVTALMEEGFGVTKLATTGGFLRSGNTTLISGVEDHLLHKAIGTIKKICHSHEQVTTTAATPVGTSGVGDSFVPYPERVTVGGATIFVLDVDRVIKV